MIKPICFFISLALLFSCSGISKTKPQSTLRDSVINFYKEEVSANRKFDTSEFSHQLLDAFLTNDTTKLNKLLIELQNERMNRKWRTQLDGCINLVSLREMNIDEGYRIEYDGAMCPMRQITTIYKRNDSIKLNFQLYQLKDDTTECKKIEEIDRVLTADNWNDFIYKIDDGDFWGLKSDNNARGVDGSDWYITGFKKGSSNSSLKYHFVYRWGQTTLSDAFQFATLLAANKKGCFWIRKGK